MSTKRAKTLLLLGMLACTRKPEAPDAAASRAEPHSPSADALNLLVLPVERAEVMYERFLPLEHHLEMAPRTPIAIRVASDFEMVRRLGENVRRLEQASQEKATDERERHHPGTNAVRTNLGVHR